MSSSAPIRWESLPLPVRLVMERLESKGFQVFLVGGCLRDLLRGENPQDYDLASTVPPEEMEQLLSPYPVIATGLRYGTVTAVVEGQALEITRLRREGGYKDGRRPDWVLPTEDIREDLARRDFTINAMAFSPSHGLIDPFGGAQDLEKRLIRAVGEPGRRFQEDGLRILRGLRFASRLDFDLEQETARALVEKRHLLGQVAQERITGEFIRLVEGMAAPRVLEEFFPVAVQVVPELQALQGFEQHTPYHIYDVWQHTLRVLDGVGEGREVRLAALFHDIAKPQCFFQGRRGIGHFKGHAVAERSLGKFSSGCVFPPNCGRKCASWCAGTTRTFPKPMKRCAGGSICWGRCSCGVCSFSSRPTAGPSPPVRILCLPGGSSSGWRTFCKEGTALP